MNFIGLLLGAGTFGTLVYTAYVLLKERQAASTRNTHHGHSINTTPILPYIAPQPPEPIGIAQPAIPDEQYQNNTSSFQQQPVTENEWKGRLFENYVAGKFDTRFFTFERWRSDKSFQGLRPVENMYPDLVFTYKAINPPISFAVECKYRSSFSDDQTITIKSEQIRRYVKYQNEYKQSVFIILGTGGTADQPEKLFIIPLSHIPVDQDFLSASFLSRHRKFSVHSNFFLQPDQMNLR